MSPPGDPVFKSSTLAGQKADPTINLSTPPSPVNATAPGDAWVILELAPDAVLVVDERGHIRFANRAAAAMFGYHRDTLVKLGVDALVPDRHRQAHAGRRAAYNASPKVRPMGASLDLWGRRADGSEFPVEISLSPVTFGDGPRVVAIVRDVSDQRAREQAIRVRLVLDEEKRMSSDLSNRVVQHLFAAGLGIQSVLGQVDQAMSERLVAITEELDAAIRDIRSTVYHQM